MNAAMQKAQSSVLGRGEVLFTLINSGCCYPSGCGEAGSCARTVSDRQTSFFPDRSWCSAAEFSP